MEGDFHTVQNYVYDMIQGNGSPDTVSQSLNDKRGNGAGGWAAQRYIITLHCGTVRCGTVRCGAVRYGPPVVE